MRTGAVQKLRAILRCHPEGLTAQALSSMIGADINNARRYLQSMPDAYIDRWEGPNRGQYAAVWCVVEVPDHCPHPAGKVVAIRQGRPKDFAFDAPVNRNTYYAND